MTLDDVVVPDTAASAAALEVVSAYQSPALLNHSLRAYVWAAAHGMTRGIGFDAELLYVAALFHDLGLLPAFDSYAVPFEEAGGHVARVFAAGAGGPSGAGYPRVDVSVDPEGYLLARATETEIIGTNADDFPPGFRAEVLESYPRLDITENFLACFEGQAKRKPDSSAAASMRSGLRKSMAGNPLDS